jgi:predicted dehydrogenase
MAGHAAGRLMHRLLFLDPGHFHATLTLRVPHPRVADDIVVYAPDGPERRDFLALVERFNRRSVNPTKWRVDVVTALDPRTRLIQERRGDIVVLAGKNIRKARTISRLRDAGFHVLADKPWLVRADDLADVRASLAGWPLAMEIMTGRHDIAARLLKRVVDSAQVFGDLRSDGPAIETASVHHLEKLVDGAPLRRPWWFFDVRVQGSGVVDIPTHQVDQSQWLAERADPRATPALIRARVWSTHVPLDSFRRMTGEARVPPELQEIFYGDTLDYRCNTQLEYRIGDVTTRASARWELAMGPGGADTSQLIAHGTRADVWREQSADTGHRRRLFVTLHDPDPRALVDLVGTWSTEFPGVTLTAAGAQRWEITIPPALDAGHEAHFALVLDEFLRAIDENRWPADVAARTLAKYAMLADAAARV